MSKRRRKGHDKKPPRWRVFGVTFALPERFGPLFAALGSQPAGGETQTKRWEWSSLAFGYLPCYAIQAANYHKPARRDG
jgi:hypothetical protein